VVKLPYQCRLISCTCVALPAVDKIVVDHVAKSFVIAVAVNEEQVFILNLLRLIPPRAIPKTGSTEHV
jgi:hypothetical protein